MKREVLVVIPARGGSKRLPRKNILPVLGVPMVVRAAKEAARSRHVTRVVVSSEDPEILEVCRSHGVETVVRPPALAVDDAPKQAVIEDTVVQLGQREDYRPDLVVSLQPNSPEFSADDLDPAIDFFTDKVYPHSPIKEVWSIGPDNIQNGCFRIMTYKTVFQRTLSTYVGIYFTDYVDVHHAEELAEAERRLRQRNHR